jgi:hypothetical protein
MEKYIVTLSAPEAEPLQALGAKGTHAAAKVINALILLNCDESQARRRRVLKNRAVHTLRDGARLSCLCSGPRIRCVAPVVLSQYQGQSDQI